MLEQNENLINAALIKGHCTHTPKDSHSVIYGLTHLECFRFFNVYSRW